MTIAGRGRPLVLAWTAFQPRSQALAQALGGSAEFVTGRRRRGPTPLPLRYARAARQTWGRLSRERPGLVVAISPPFLCPLVAWIWCRLHSARLVIDCHTGAFHGSRWAWARPVSKWLARRADLVTLHTESHRAEVVGWGAKGMLLPDDVPGPDQAEPVPAPGRPVVLVAGSMDDNEPVEAAIEAARLLPEVEVRLTGDRDRLPSDLVRSAPANVVFTGWLAYPRFLGELLVADVAAAFSVDPHIMNRAAFEAVGLGRALVLSDLPGLRDRFGSAAVFCANEPQAMAAALRDALQRRQELERQSVTLQSDLEAQRQAALELMGSLLRSSPRRLLMVSQHPFDNPTLARNVDCLLEQGWELDVYCSAKPGLEQAAPRPGLHVRMLRPLRAAEGSGTVAHRRSGALWYPIEYVAFFLRVLPRATWLSFRHRYDCVQVDNVPDFLVFVAAAARLRGARVVHFMYEVMPEMTASLLHVADDHPLVRLVSWQERRATAWADRVVTVAEAGRRRLEARGVDPAKVVVIPNTRPASATSLPPPAASKRPEGPTLVTHGTLLKRYGVQVAIRALRELRPRWPELTLQVLGEGEYRPVLEELVVELDLQDAVQFTGFLPWEDAMARVRSATVGVVPVLADGYGQLLLPNKLFEYVASGVPAVCSRLPIISEYFPADSLGYFEEGDPAGLAAQVDRLLQDPRLRASQAAAARQAVEAVSWERVSGDYLAALQPA